MLKINLSLLSLILSLLIIASSCGNASYKKTASGVEYKFLKNGKGNKVQEGDFIKVQVIRYMGDSLLFDSHKVQPDIIQYKKDLGSGQKFNLFEVLALAKVGDSIAMRVPLDSIFKDNPNKPAFYKKGSYARIFLSIIDITNAADQAKEIDKQKASMIKELVIKAQGDKAAIEAFVAKNKLHGNFNNFGVFVIINKEGKGSLIATDSTISVVYTGKLLNGSLFDSNADRVKKDKNALLTFKAGIGQLIPGFDYSLIGIKKGSNVRFLIPSALAYGERGAGEKVPANSILDFTIEIQ